MPEAPALPAPARELVPHRPPMLLVETLTGFVEGAGTVEAAVPAGGAFTREDGLLEPVALLELMAQAYAAVKGFDLARRGLPVLPGFLVGVKEASIPGRAFAGDRLRVEVRLLSTVGPFAVAEGSVHRGGDLLASAEMKLWIPGVPGIEEERG